MKKRAARQETPPLKRHVGMFPQVKGDAALEKALAKYRDEKGN